MEKGVSLVLIAKEEQSSCVGGLLFLTALGRWPVVGDAEPEFYFTRVLN